MAVYNPKSLKAEEFINHGEILDTLRYAEENKNNVELIDALLEKARPKKWATKAAKKALLSGSAFFVDKLFWLWYNTVKQQG